MASALTNLTLVRQRSGVDSTLVDDTAGQAIIDQTEAYVIKRYNTQFVPRIEVEIVTGDATNRFRVRRIPLTRVLSLTIGTTSIDPEDLSWDRFGLVYMKQAAERYTSDASDRGTNKIVYEYAMLEEDYSVTATTTTNAETAGTSVTVEVGSSSGITANAYVKIIGVDGFEEIAKVSSVPGGTSIIVDRLVVDHAAGSYVQLMQIPPIVKQYATVIASLGFVANVVGSSFDEIVGYEIDELRVQKGEPYTQWRETAVQLLREKQEIEAVSRGMAAVAVA